MKAATTACLWVLCLLCDAAHANALTVDYVRDPGGEFSIEQIANRDDWRPLVTEGMTVPSFGFSADTFWVRVRLGRELPRNGYLEIEYSALDEVVFFEQIDARFREVGRSGDTLSFADRDIPHRGHVFEITHGSDARYFFKVKTSGSVQLPVHFHTPAGFASHNSGENLLYGLYYGYMLLLTIAALVAAVHLREALFAYYFCYVICLLSTMASINGFAYQYFWPRGGLWPSISGPLFVASASVFAVLFAGAFLGPRCRTKSASVGFVLVYSMAGATLLACIGQSSSIVIKLGTLTGMIAVPAILWPTFIAFRRGVQGAKYFLVAWGIFLSAFFSTGLVLFGLAPSNFFTNNIMQISSMIDVLILSMALVERGRQLRAQKERAIADTRDILISTNQRLEAEVADRTRDLRTKNEELAQLAARDSLTSLLNHETVFERLNEELSAASRFKHDVAVLMIDIDHFKSVNDEFGHQLGDEVLVAVAQTLKNRLRQYDICGRYGGDEFIMVLGQTSREGAIKLAERLRKDIAELCIPNAPACRITASFGIAVYDHKAAPLETRILVSYSDRALYEAKGSGRNIVRVYANGDNVPHSVS
ncbi:MAG: diguanylate cyclase [Pseudomonadota bacterium]